jgi:hypothetical protein
MEGTLGVLVEVRAGGVEENILDCNVFVAIILPVLSNHTANVVAR